MRSKGSVRNEINIPRDYRYICHRLKNDAFPDILKVFDEEEIWEN